MEMTLEMHLKVLREQIADDIMTAHYKLECCKLVSPLCSCESAAHIALHGC
jgi:hypothetical protein